MRLPTQIWPVIVLWAVALPSTALKGQSTNDLSQILRAGEFSRAQQRIGDLPPNQRDAARAQLAVAQLAGGAPFGAARTFGSIADSSLAHSTLSSANSTLGGRGGGIVADFTTLMDLIRETINPDSWEDAEGEGRMFPFPAGVLIDSRGKLSLVRRAGVGLRLDEVHATALADRGNRDVRARSALRKVSLTRLERQLQLRAAAGLPATDAMQHVAGLYAITHVLVYPESGEIVIAGPADGWTADGLGNHVARSSRKPTLWLDDWIEVWRNECTNGGSFYCSIEPRPENLSRTVAFLAEARKNGITGAPDTWLQKLQEVLGEQDLVVEGISPRSRLAHVILEADYHMKRVGLGLEESVFGVPSYLELLGAEGSGEANRVLRWWFTLADQPVTVAAGGHAFELPKRIAQLQSENPRIQEDGRRQATGKRDPANHRFATLFTKNFDVMAKRYPVYDDLRNVMHWALVAALIHREIEAGAVDWRGEYFLDVDRCPVRYGGEPTAVDSVVNSRRFKSGRVVYAVSGGVEISARTWLAGDHRLKQDQYGKLPALHEGQRRPAELPAERWWWD